jgi:hypothetical protein
MTDYTKLKATIEALDCGAHGCIYAMSSSPGGMRTNGGCHCLAHAPADVRMRVTGLATLLRAENTDLIRRADAAERKLREIGCGMPGRSRQSVLNDVIAVLDGSAKS